MIDEDLTRPHARASRSYLTHALAFGAGAAVAVAVVRGRHVLGALKSYAFRDRLHAAAGYSGASDVVLRREAYAVGYSLAAKGPLWASMYICRWSCEPFGARSLTETFASDAELPAQHRAHATDYNSSGYDRGHLAPRQTVGYSAAVARDSFLLSNALPQDPTLNRSAWRELEADVRRWTKRHGKMAVVVGGTFAADRSAWQTIGRGVAVPTHFYVAVTCVRKPWLSAGFLLPNAPPQRPAAAGWKWQFCALSLNDLEAATGRPIFRSLPVYHRPWKRRVLNAGAWK